MRLACNLRGVLGVAMTVSIRAHHRDTQSATLSIRVASSSSTSPCFQLHIHPFVLPMQHATHYVPASVPHQPPAVTKAHPVVAHATSLQPGLPMTRVRTTTTTVTETITAQISLDAPPLPPDARDRRHYPLAKLVPSSAFKRFAVEINGDSHQSVSLENVYDNHIRLEFSDARYEQEQRRNSPQLVEDGGKKRRFMHNEERLDTESALNICAHAPTSRVVATPVSAMARLNTSGQFVRNPLHSNAPDTPGSHLAITPTTLPGPLASPHPLTPLANNSFAPDVPPPSPPPQLALDETSGALNPGQEVLVGAGVSMSRQPAVSFIPGIGVNGLPSTYLSPNDALAAYDAAPNALKAWILMEMMKRTPREPLAYTLSSVIPNIRVDVLSEAPDSHVRTRILSKLDARTLGRIACVSKRWNALLGGSTSLGTNSAEKLVSVVDNPTDVLDSVSKVWRTRLLKDELCSEKELSAARTVSNTARYEAELGSKLPSHFGLGGHAPDESDNEDAQSLGSALSFESSPSAESADGEEPSTIDTTMEELISNPDDAVMSQALDELDSAMLASNENPDVSSLALLSPNTSTTSTPPTIPISLPLPTECDKQPVIPLLHSDSNPNYKALYQRLRRLDKAWRHGAYSRLTFPGNSNNVVTAIIFSGERIITASDDNTVCVFDANTGALARKLVGHEGGVWALAAYGDCVVTGGTDRTVRVWDIATGVCRQVLYGHTSTVRCCKIILPRQVEDAAGKFIEEPDVPLIVTGSRDFTIRVWKLPLGTDETDPNATQGMPDPFLKVVFQGHSGSVRSIDAWGRYLLSGSYDTTAMIWDLVKQEKMHILEGHTTKVYSAVMEEGAKLCATGSLDGVVRVWEVQTGACLRSLDAHSSLVGTIFFERDLLISASADMRIRSWHLPSGEPAHTFRGHKGAITCLQSSYGRMVSGSDGTLKLWDIKSGKFVHNLLNELNGVWQVKFDRKRCVAAVQRKNKTWFEVLDFDAVAEGHMRAGHHRHIAQHSDLGLPTYIRESDESISDEHPDLIAPRPEDVPHAADAPNNDAPAGLLAPFPGQPPPQHNANMGNTIPFPPILQQPLPPQVMIPMPLPTTNNNPAGNVGAETGGGPAGANQHLQLPMFQDLQQLPTVQQFLQWFTQPLISTQNGNQGNNTQHAHVHHHNAMSHPFALLHHPPHHHLLQMNGNPTDNSTTQHQEETDAAVPTVPNDDVVEGEVPETIDPLISSLFQGPPAPLPTSSELTLPQSQLSAFPSHSVSISQQENPFLTDHSESANVGEIGSSQGASNVQNTFDAPPSSMLPTSNTNQQLLASMDAEDEMDDSDYTSDSSSEDGTSDGDDEHPRGCQAGDMVTSTGKRPLQEEAESDQSSHPRPLLNMEVLAENGSTLTMTTENQERLDPVLLAFHGSSMDASALASDESDHEFDSETDSLGSITNSDIFTL